MTTLIILPVQLNAYQPKSMQTIAVSKLDVEHGDPDMQIVISTICNTSGFETMISETYANADGLEVSDELELEGHRDMVSAIMWHREAVRRYTVVPCRCCNGAGGWGDADCPADCSGGLIYQGKLEDAERELHAQAAC